MGKGARRSTALTMRSFSVEVPPEQFWSHKMVEVGFDFFLFEPSSIDHISILDRSITRQHVSKHIEIPKMHSAVKQYINMYKHFYEIALFEKREEKRREETYRPEYTYVKT